MQVFNQLAGAGLTIVLAVAGSVVILKLVDLFIGLRVSESDEAAGLDVTQHGETAYVFEGESIHASNEPATAPSLTPAFETK